MPSSEESKADSLPLAVLVRTDDEVSQASQRIETWFLKVDAASDPSRMTRGDVPRFVPSQTPACAAVYNADLQRIKSTGGRDQSHRSLSHSSYEHAPHVYPRWRQEHRKYNSLGKPARDVFENSNKTDDCEDIKQPRAQEVPRNTPAGQPKAQLQSNLSLPLSTVNNSQLVDHALYQYEELLPSMEQLTVTDCIDSESDEKCTNSSLYSDGRLVPESQETMTASSPREAGSCSSESPDNETSRIEQIPRVSCKTALISLKSTNIRNHPAQGDSNRPMRSRCDTSQSSGSLQSYRSSQRTRNRNLSGSSHDDNQSDNEDENNHLLSQHAGNAEIRNGTRLFACPFYKFDPSRYSEQNETPGEENYRHCSSSCLRTIPRLKQHLLRVHCLPQHFCNRCSEIFKSDDDLQFHQQALTSCDYRTPQFVEKIRPDRYSEIKKRRLNVDHRTLWYEIYKILFPGAPGPASPYIESENYDPVKHFAIFFKWSGLDIMREFIRQRELEQPLSSDTSRIVHRALTITSSDTGNAQPYENSDHSMNLDENFSCV